MDVKLSCPKTLKLDAESKLAASINLFIKNFPECVLKQKEVTTRLKTKTNRKNNTNNFIHLCRVSIRDNVIRFCCCEFQTEDKQKNVNNGLTLKRCLPESRKSTSRFKWNCKPD